MSLRPRRVWRRTPLWLRLITTVLALSIVALTVMGVFGARLLRGYLVDRVDDQLVEVAANANSFVRNVDPNAPHAPSPYYIQFDGINDQSWVLSNPMGKGVPALPSLTIAEADARNLKAFTVPATDGDGSFRTVATPASIRLPNTGERVPGTLLIATSLHDVDATVHKLSTINLLVGAAVIAGLALAAYTMVRTALRPLTKIEQTAAAIAGGDLSRRVDNADPNTEVGVPRPRGVRGHRPPLRGEDAALRRRRQPRTAHATHVDPGVRGAAPAGGGD